MGIGTSIFLVATGAILRYAVSDAIDGVDLSTVGLILMLCGLAGLVISFLMMAMARDRVREPDVVVRERRYTDPAPPL
jgi:hypothetical protein